MALGYDKGHGAELRKERREFAKSTAGSLAAASMAEVERKQVGDTRRTRLSEAGQTERRGMYEAGQTSRLGTKEAGLGARQAITEAGSEKRNLRQYGPGGLTERGQIRTADTAANRLSDTISLRGEKQADEIFDATENELLSGLVDPVTEVLPERYETLRLEARTAQAKDGSGTKVLQEGMKKIEDFNQSLLNMSESQMLDLRNAMGN